MSPATFSGESAALGPVSARLTLVVGSGFCLSTPSGDIDPDSPQGLFFEDTRFLSRFQLRFDGRTPETLATVPHGLHAADVIARVHADQDSAPPLLVFRHRSINSALTERIVLRNAGVRELRGTLELLVRTDFAGLFEVKEDRVERHRMGRTERDGQEIAIIAEDGEHVTRLRFDQPFDFDGDGVRFAVAVPAKGEWAVEVGAVACHGDENAARKDDAGEAEGVAERLFVQWRSQAPRLDGGGRLAGVVDRSVADLGALRIFDRRYGGRGVLAAGAPWFMTLFGRDSLLASWMALIVDPGLAIRTLEVLAELQGCDVDERTEEEPGRILHEVRFGRSSLLAPGGGTIYYGTADATPLFAALAGEVARWGADRETVERLLPHVDRALEWIDRWGDRDGDGYVEYECRTEDGLVNQGWKDSWDSISFADGRLAAAPIALCEVQAYVYAAFLARAELADLVDDAPTAKRWRRRARELRRRFNEDFWVDERGWFAMALDRDKQPVDSLASNIGHALWTGIVEEDRAAATAARLVSDELFSGWGVRTLGRSMRRYDPLSYHNGSVWPHDSALAAAGLMRYGFVDDAHLLLDALLAAADHYHRHLPELFSGLDRTETSVPVDYPTSSAPQAWAAAAPLLAVRTLLRFDPDVPRGRLHLAPALLPGMNTLRIEKLPVDGSRVSIDVDGDDVDVTGVPPHLTVVTEPARLP